MSASRQTTDDAEGTVIAEPTLFTEPSEQSLIVEYMESTTVIDGHDIFGAMPQRVAPSQTATALAIRSFDRECRRFKTRKVDAPGASPVMRPARMLAAIAYQP